jgi:8-oxo-dGTP pyrophosphatase MutT (NUDIX family)
MPMSDYILHLREKIGHQMLFLPCVSGVIRDRDDRVLLARHSEGGQWTVPGGAIEPEETPADAVVRELWEETALVVRPQAVRGIYGGPEFALTYVNGDRVTFVTIMFDCQVTGGDARPDGLEILELQYFTSAEVAHLDLQPWVRTVTHDLFRKPDSALFRPPAWRPPNA